LKDSNEYSSKSIRFDERPIKEIGTFKTVNWNIVSDLSQIILAGKNF